MRETPAVLPPPELDAVRVVLADDDPLFARAMRARLSLHPELEIVGIASDGVEAVDLAAALEPDIVLMDVSMPRLDGIAATERIRQQPSPPAVVLITGDDQESDSRAYEAGAAAYLRKSTDLLGLVDVIVAVSQLVGAGG